MSNNTENNSNNKSYKIIYSLIFILFLLIIILAIIFWQINKRDSDKNSNTIYEKSPGIPSEFVLKTDKNVIVNNYYYSNNNDNKDPSCNGNKKIDYEKFLKDIEQKNPNNSFNKTIAENKERIREAKEQALKKMGNINIQQQQLQNIPPSEEIAKGLNAIIEKGEILSIRMGYSPTNKKRLFVFSDPNCPHCIDEFITLKDFVQKYNDVNVYIIPVSIIGQDISTRELTQVMCSGLSKEKEKVNPTDIDQNNKTTQYIDLMDKKANKTLYKLSKENICSTGVNIIINNNKLFNIIGAEGTPALYNSKGILIKDFNNIDSIYKQL